MSDLRKVPTWDEYYIEIAKTVSIRSKDPNTQVGAVIVKNGRIVSSGYNGMPAGYPETPEDWERPNKYDLVLHAEVNAILHSSASLEGASLYVTLSPCRECAKNVVASGIKTVYYSSTRGEFKESLDYLNKCGVVTVKV